MTSKGWSVKDLINRLELIKKRLETETRYERLRELESDYKNLSFIINEHFSDEKNKDTLSLLEKFNTIKNELLTLRFLWGDIYNFYDIASPIIEPPLPKLELSNNDILEITHDFYKQLNPFFYKNFSYFFNMHKTHIQFNTKTANPRTLGDNTNIFSLGEAFIKVNRLGNHQDVITTIHEYMHATSSKINREHFTYKKRIFSEIDSIFMGLIGADYLETLTKDKANIIINSGVHTNKYYSVSDISKYLNLIKLERRLPNGFKSENQLKRLAQKELGISDNELYDLLTYPNLDAIMYINSYLFALELYRLYNKDKDKALYYLKKIILLENMSSYEFYQKIMSFGFIPTESLNAFQKYCEKNISRIRRR